MSHTEKPARREATKVYLHPHVREYIRKVAQGRRLGFSEHIEHLIEEDLRRHGIDPFAPPGHGAASGPDEQPAR